MHKKWLLPLAGLLIFGGFGLWWQSQTAQEKTPSTGLQVGGDSDVAPDTGESGTTGMQDLQPGPSVPDERKTVQESHSGG